MSLEQIQQNYADATAYVIDRTVSPPKVLGEAFIVSKSRAVTCASIVFNYTEAPWAIELYFPHPNVSLGVRAINLHNDFDKVAARKWYLAQTGNPGDQLSLANDMAALSLDFQMQELQPDKVGELDRALAVPFVSEGVDASGTMVPSEFESIIGQALQSQLSGLLTFFDSRNIPVARVEISPGQIQKVYFRGLLGELAFFELWYRRPVAGYSFQSKSTFNWGSVREITAPADALAQEAERRVADLPAMLTYLGGANARYQRRSETLSAEDMSENLQWMTERLWGAIDGYMTLDKMSERVGSDTYSVIQAMRELVNKASVSMINRATPFHCSGQIGTPLISHTDFEINAWDPLQAFYLDPLSGCPTWLQGNFFGVGNALQPKNMLHTIPMPVTVPGALVLKDYKLIGLHSAPHVPKPGQPLPPVKLSQFMWMGALLELTSKKARGMADDGSAEAGFSGLRNRAEPEETASTTPEKLDKFICPSCFSTNTQVGPCFNCGTVIEAPPVPTDEELGKVTAKEKVVQFQQKHKISNTVMMVIVAFVVGVPLCVVAAFMNRPAPVETKQAVSSETTHKSSEKAIQVASSLGGFKATAIPSYWYIDTMDQTQPNKSFGLDSEASNQHVVFVVFDDLAPVNNLGNFVGKPPYTDVLRQDDLGKSKIDEGSMVLGDGKMQWFLGKYEKPKSAEDPNTLVEDTLLIGGYPSPEKGKSVLVIGRALSADKQYDYKSTLWLCDQMASDYTARGNADRAGESKPIVASTSTSTDTSASDEEKPIATDEDIDVFCKKLEETLQAKLSLPDDVKESLGKKKPPKIRASLLVAIDESGKVVKLETKQLPDESSVVDSMTNAVNQASPYEGVPHTAAGKFNFLVKLNQDQISVVKQ